MTKPTKQFFENSKKCQSKPQYFASLENFVRKYLEHQVCYKRPETLQEDQKLLQDIILPVLGHIKIQSVTQNDIEKLHKKLKKTPYQATRVLALLSKMFSLAIAWEGRDDNPTIGIEQRYPEQQDRCLDEKALKQLWGVLDSHPDHLATHALKFLTLTGARKSEVLQTTWDQLDLKKRIWAKPSLLTKQKKEELIPLSEKAIKVLQSVRKLRPQESLYVFFDRSEAKHLKEINMFWKIALGEAKLHGIRISDLRRVYASHPSMAQT